MKTLLFGSILLSATLIADVNTVTPYLGSISYDNSSAKSLKDDAKFAGFYSSSGNLDHLWEFSYNYLDISYKDTLNIDNLKQHDLTLIYNAYQERYMYKIGGHYISNNEDISFRDLGSGFVGIVGVAGYTWFEKNKLTYGLDAYFSFYKDAHNDLNLLNTQNVNVAQATPYLSYNSIVSTESSNTIMLKANIISASDYIDSNYFSFEISDTFFYNKFYATLKYIGGKMKSAVTDSGFIVFNTKDLMKDSYGAKLGYTFQPNISADISYTINNYEEYNAATLQLLPEGSRSIAVFSFNYTF